MSDRLQVNIERTPEEALTIHELLTRGVETIMPDKGLQEILEGDPTRLYLGIDPTAKHIHIGHAVPIRKLRQFQKLGHHVILLFGTFTGMIGDPSDKTAARVRLTREQVDHNVATYSSQAGRILDLSSTSPNPVEVVYNHEWLAPLTFMDVVELAANFTVNQFIARETYRRRLDEGVPLYVHELLYPIMQGFDSVALNVQLEVGGKDQIPNMLAGTTLMRVLSGTPKWVMGMKLIEDPSGAKMGKTTGNVVNIEELPEVVYEAMMTWPDGAIAVGLELLTGLPMAIVNEVAAELKANAEGKGSSHPMDLKEAFAFRVVADLHGEIEAVTARHIYDLVKRQKQLPPRMREVELEAGTTLMSALVATGLVRDIGEAQSKLSQQAVRLNGQQLRKDLALSPGEYVVELGKNSIKNVRKVKIG